MAWIISKYLITAAMVVLISEIAKRSDKLGALLAALPMITVLTLLWLYFEKQPTDKIANHAWYTFWYVIPTLPMFLVFPYVMHRYSFWPAMLVSIPITIASFLLLAFMVKRFGIHLL